MGRVHFKGLNSLRFFAALFVVIGHIPLNQESVGLPYPRYGALFFRGSPAVSFFFTLSGFLITYLLLEERRRTGDVDVRSFYLRRVCRIWPLYFAVVFFGLFFYNALLPALGIGYKVEYSLPLAVLLYTFFLPNLMNTLYTVGGILNPSWSIGVEEQFYLFWAPAMKRVRERVPALCWTVLVVSATLYVLSDFGVFGAYEGRKFVGQLKFHFMAAGALCAWWLHRYRDSFLAQRVFSSKAVQILLFALLADFYLLNLAHWHGLAEEAVQMLLYPWVIVNVAANPRNVIPVENRVFDYLGTISYGMYMLHMMAVYATSALFKATGWWRGNLWLFCAGYYAMALGLTVLLAHLSYRHLESPFLRLKEQRYSLLPSAPSARAPADLPL
jgi:peptidoglycan/LPS O-acetylase OafA/YrhL